MQNSDAYYRYMLYKYYVTNQCEFNANRKRGRKKKRISSSKRVTDFIFLCSKFHRDDERNKTSATWKKAAISLDK